MTGMEITEVLGNLGDFIGAIAVFGTIVYLAIQVRHSKEATEANTRAIEDQRKVVAAQAIRDVELSLAEFNREVAANAKLTGLAQKVAKEEHPERWSFDEYTEIRFYLMSFAMLTQAEFRNGRLEIGDELSTRQYLRNFKAIVETVPGAKLFWEREQGTFADGFKEAIDAIDDFPEVAQLFEASGSPISAPSDDPAPPSDPS